MDSVAHTIARNSAFGFAAQGLMKVLSFAFTVLIVRHLGAEAYGQYAAVLAFGAVFIFLADLGLSPYTVRQVARARGEAADPTEVAALYGNVLVVRMVLSIITAGLLVAAAWWTDRPPAMVGAIALGSLGLLMYALQGTSEAILAGFERLDLASGAKVLNQVIFVAVGAVLLLLGSGYYGLIFASLAGVFLMTVFSWRAAHRLGVRAVRPDFKRWPGLMRAGLPFGVIAFTLGLSYRFDTVLLNVFRGDAETGYYNAAYNLVFSAALISNVLNTSLYPSLVRQASSAAGSLGRSYEQAFRYLVLLSLPIAVGCWATAEQLVPALFGEGYGPTAGVLQILIWAVPLMFVSEFLGYVVVIQGREGRVARAILLSTALNVGVNLLLVPRFGLQTAAVMTVVTEAVLVTQYIVLLRGMLRGFNWSHVLMRPAIAVLGMGAVALAVRESPLPIVLVAAAVTYVGLLVALRVVGPDEVRFVRSLRRSPVAQEPLAA
jgi:O-antigen/teichoic acid export membrane protein